VLRTVELVPGYVVPERFRAIYDDPESPWIVTLTILVRRTEAPVVFAEFGPRVVSHDIEMWEQDGRASALELTPYAHAGPIPETSTPQLLREALMKAAMPEEQPLVTRAGAFTGELPPLPRPRAPKTSLQEWKVIRQAYEEALTNDSLSMKYEVLEHVFGRVHEAFPDRWKRGDGKTPDYYRLRSYLRRIDLEKRAAAT
jgi:hypothetical protein